MSNSYPVRYARLALGIVLYGLGIHLTIQANVGLAPWEAFAIGLTNHIPFSYGVLSALIGLVILVVDVWLGEKIGIGTIVNTIFVGIVVDIAVMTGVVPLLDSLPAGIVMLLAGLAVICLASYHYIGSGFGCGPRDSLMVALGKRLSRVPIGAVRGAIEGSVLFVGWLLGAKVGVGTVISAFGIGFLLQIIFRALRFDVKAVEHESLGETLARIRSTAS